MSKIKIELFPVKIGIELFAKKSELKCQNYGIELSRNHNWTVKKSELKCKEIRIELSRNHNLTAKKPQLNCQEITIEPSKITIELENLELNNEPSGPSYFKEAPYRNHDMSQQP